MAQKVTAEVRERLDAGEREVPVIVTLAPGAEAAAVERQGLMWARAFENIPAVAGSVTAEQLDRLEEAPEVERIEYDGEMHAL